MADMRIDVENGIEFTADEASVSHSPVKFMIDFRSVTPRIETGSKEPRMVMRHNVVRVDPYFAKELLSVLKDNIEKFEKKFGTIEKPKALEQAEKNKHDHSKKEVKQDYFG